MLTLSIKFSLKIKGGELFKSLFEKIISLDFPALKVTFHFCAQQDIRKDKSDNTLAYEDSAYTVILRTFIYFFQIVTHIGQEWSII